MPTTNPRVNITLDPEHLKMLQKFAASQHKSVSAATKHLVLQALELQEDSYFSELSEKIDCRTKKWVSHDDAWK